MWGANVRQAKAEAWQTQASFEGLKHGPNRNITIMINH